MNPDISEQVALITGRIIHESTGEAIIGHIWITAQEGPVVGTLVADGFAVSGRPELLFPQLSSHNYQLTLIIRAESAQFRAGVVEQQLLVPIPLGTTFDPPIDVDVIALPADPVNIRGRVVEAVNPETPISGAMVEVLHGGPAIPPSTTDPEGRYHFDNIIVLEPAELRCSATDFKTQQRLLLPDFRKLLHEEYFRLPPP
jgi:hypothetical protein